MKYLNTMNDFTSTDYDEVVEDIKTYLLDEYIEEELSNFNYAELFENLTDDFKTEILERAEANAINDYLVELEDEEGENEDE
jgi:hypothetical protein